MQRGGFGKDLGSGFDRVAAALGKGPSHEPASLARMGGGEFCGQSGGLGPALHSLQEAEFELHDTAVRRHGRGKVLQFLQRIGGHAKVGVTHRAFSPLKIFPKLIQPAHAESYHKRCEN